MNQPNETEETLAELMRNQQDLYSKLIPQAEDANRKLDDGQSIQEELEGINNVMTEIRTLDRQMDPLRQALNDAMRNQQLSTLKNSITDQIKRLVEQTTLLEQKIKTARDGLMPNINEHVKKSKMHRAYSGS